MDTTSTAAKIRRRIWTTLAVGTSVFCSLMTIGLAATSGNTPPWNFVLGFLLNLGAAVMLVWRYQHPWRTLAFSVAGPLFFATDGTAALIALFATTAVARGRKLLGASLLVFVACGVSLTYDAFRRRDYSVLTIGAAGERDGLPVPDWQIPLWLPWLAAALLVALVVGVGLLRQTQSDLAVAENGRARATAESAAMREEMVRVAERARIARDMHDTLAASLGRVSLLAGGLQVNSTEGPAKVANSASLIRDTAHGAMDDLRRIVGVLRSGNDDDISRARNIGTIPDLVSAARSAGAHVTLFVDLLPGDPGPIASHVAYRVIQESITNAQKHAPESSISVALTGSYESGIRVDVRNPASPVPVPPASGSRTGLQGLAEQVHSVGGTFDARGWSGVFVVAAWLPWHT